MLNLLSKFKQIKLILILLLRLTLILILLLRLKLKLKLTLIYKELCLQSRSVCRSIEKLFFF